MLPRKSRPQRSPAALLRRPLGVAPQGHGEQPMKPFNLAESRIAQRTYCQTHMNRRIRMIALLSAAAVVVSIVTYACNVMIAGRAEKARIGLANVEKRCQSIASKTESAKAELDERQWLDQLAKVSDGWLGVIDSSLGSLPEDVWVSRVETSPKDSSLLIEGRAANFDSLSAFIGALHRNPSFSDIRLASARITRIGGLSCVDFSVPIKLKASAASSEQSTTAQASQVIAGRPGA